MILVIDQEKAPLASLGEPPDHAEEYDTCDNSGNNHVEVILFEQECEYGEKHPCYWCSQQDQHPELDYRQAIEVQKTCEDAPEAFILCRYIMEGMIWRQFLIGSKYI